MTGLRRLGSWMQQHPALATLFGALTVALVGLSVWMVTSGISANASGGWSASGVVGDSFGGTVGPLLSFAALMATVILALVVQPRNEARARAQKEDDDAVDRAERVVAWVAETYSRTGENQSLISTEDSKVVGVVVANDSGSAVRDLDIALDVLTRSGKTQRVVNRESVIPPGTWFIPVEEGAQAATSHLWKLPVPVEASGVPTVNLVDTDTLAESLAQRQVIRPYSLRPHLPQPRCVHHELHETRYVLHGEAWRRGRDGRPERATTRPDAEEAVYRETVSAIREEVAGPASDQAMSHLVRETMRALTGADDAHDHVYRRFETKPEVLPGVRRVSRNRATGFYLHLSDDEAGPIIRIAGNKHRVYPDVIEYFAEFDLSKRPPGPKGRAHPALSEALMRRKRQVCGEAPSAERWLGASGILAHAWWDLLADLVAEATPDAGSPGETR